MTALAVCAAVLALEARFFAVARRSENRAEAYMVGGLFFVTVAVMIMRAV